MTHPVVETLDWLIEYWPDLLEARLPLATRRPWRQPHLTPAAREERDRQAAEERAERNPLAIGESPAPVDVNVLQVALDVLVRADDLAAELGIVTMCPILPPLAYGDLDARPYLRYAAARITEDDSGALAEWAAPTVQLMYEQVAKALAMLYTGQTVRVVCPWCRGVTPETPAGGAHTWRVVELPSVPPQIAIMCTGICEPSAKEVGTWWGSQPCWPISEWPKLAKRARESK